MELEKKMESDNIKQIVPTGHGMARFLKEHGVEHVFGIDDAIKAAITSDDFNLVDITVDPIELLPPNFY